MGFREEFHLYGVRCTIIDNETAKKYHILPVHLRQVAEDRFLYIASWNREKLLRAAGYDMQKIDFAVPQDWFEQPEVAERMKNEFAIWSYEEPHTYGAPVWSSEAWGRVEEEIRSTMPCNAPDT